jgi:hypothetical protein
LSRSRPRLRIALFQAAAGLRGQWRRAPKCRRHLRRTALPIASANLGGNSPLTFERIAMLDDGVDRVLESEIGGMMFAISRDAGGWAAFPGNKFELP